MDISRLFKTAEKFTIDNSPAILTVLGVSGVVTTAYLAAKAATDAMLVLQQEDARRLAKDNRTPPMDIKEMVPLVWKIYIPPVTAGTLTITAIIASNRVSSRRAAGLAAAYSISERAFSEYKEKVIERVGEKKEQSYRDEIAQERVNRNPVDDKQVLITNGGEVLCYDNFTGRYFKSSMETIRQAQNEINYQIVHQGYASLSEFYQKVGLPVTSISEEVGWNTDQLLELDISTILSTDSRPCIAIDFDLQPTRRFDKFG